MNEVGNTPTLITPGLDLSTVDQKDIEFTAKQLKEQNPDVSEDTIVSWLSYMKEHGESLTQQRYDNLLAGDPVLTSQEISNIAVEDIKNLGESNPWLAPNATTMFTIAFLDLAAKLSEIKMDEAQAAIVSINLVMEMAYTIADLILDVAKKEAWKNYTRAITSAVSAGFSAYGGIKATGKRKVVGEDGKTKKVAIDSGQAMAITQKWSAVGKLAEAGGEVAQGVLTMQKGALESIKQMVEAQQKIQERVLDQAFGAYKSKDDEVAQIIQKLTQIISEAYKAHSLRAG